MSSNRRPKRKRSDSSATTTIHQSLGKTVTQKQQPVPYDEIPCAKAKEFENSYPTKIFAVDVDGTLVVDADTKDHNKDSNTDSKTTPFNNQEKIKNLFKLANINKVMIVIVTGRDYLTEQAKQADDPLTVKNILKGLGAENFSYIYFTNDTLKFPVLEKLYQQYILSNPNRTNNPDRREVCLVDDNLLQLFRSQRFSTININDANAYEEMRKFIEEPFKPKAKISIPQNISFQATATPSVATAATAASSSSQTAAFNCKT